ncbi:MAG: hypothetical protein ACREPR_06535 [Brasilonema sp.]
MKDLRLNLGCGAKRLDGYINVDKFGTPDLRFDLETFPYPWANDSVAPYLDSGRIRRDYSRHIQTTSDPNITRGFAFSTHIPHLALSHSKITAKHFIF